MLWRSNPSSQRESKAKRRRRMLVEFLNGRYAQKQANIAEETSSQDMDIEVENPAILLYDMLFMIFIVLPASSLFRLQFVCKMWFSLINSSPFIRCHSQQSETVLISRRLIHLEPAHYAALGHVSPPGFDDKPRSYFHFLNLDYGENNFIESSVVDLAIIRASNDGLILATSRKSKRLILMNPVTRKQIDLPLGTEVKSYVESFSIILCNQTYKVVHLFRDKEIGRSIGCMILNICTKKWTRIEGPPSDLSICMRKFSISVGKSLNLMPLRRGGDYFVSMNVDDKRFISKKLPVISGSKDRLLEIGGDLGFVSHEEADVLQVWVLMSNGGFGEEWIKKCSISTSVYFAVSPRLVCCLKNGKRVVIETKDGLYEYDFESGEIKMIRSRSYDQVGLGRVDWMYIPHRNTLASWEDHLEVMY